MAKKVKVPEGGRVPVATLKLDPDEAKKLRAMAETAEIPLAIYIRLVFRRHLKTPFDLSISNTSSERPKRKAS